MSDESAQSEPTRDAKAGEHPSGLALSCDEARRQITYLIEEGDLKEAERSLLFMHLRTCPECKAVLDRNRQLETQLRRAFSGLDTSLDFAQDVLDALPPEEKLEGPRWLSSSSRAQIEALAREPSGPKRSFFQLVKMRARWLFAHRLPLMGVAILLFAIGTAFWIQDADEDPSRMPPYLTGIEGSGVLLRGKLREAPLGPGVSLETGDLVEARMSRKGAPLKITMASQSRSLGAILLRPAAKLRVITRSRFELLQGEAYFDVRKRRPRRPDEAFTVVTPLGHVEVVGTAFTVMVPLADPDRVTVSVERGEVQLRPLAGGSPMRLTKQEEADLLEGGVSSLRAAEPARLAWVYGVPVVAKNTVVQAPKRPHSKPTPAPGAPPRLDWRTEVNRLDFTGHTFATALLMLSDDLGRPAELIDLAREANKRDERRALPVRLTLVLRRRLPLGVVVRWLARESGWVWAPGSTGAGIGGGDPGTPDAEKRVPLWLPAVGLAPPDRNAIIEGLGPAAFPPRALGRYLDSLAERANENLLVAPEARGAPLDVMPDEDGGSFLFALDRAVTETDMARAFYDGIWYVAPPETIERITRVPRSISHWAGKPIRPGVAGPLAKLVSRMKVQKNGAFTMGPNGRLLVGNVTASDGGNTLRFVAGLVGRRLLLDALRFIERGSPRVVLTTEALDDYNFPEVERNLDQLIEEARRKGVKVIVKGKTIPLEKHAFVNRSLSLGKALGWAARLSGLGVRAGKGHLVIDDWSICYGTPRLRILDLGVLSTARPREAGTWGRVFAERLKTMYPVLFHGIECFPIGDRLLFEADRRRLAASQQLLEELDRVLRKSPAVDPATWRPAWRIALDDNLAQPYRGAPSGVLDAGSFVGRLKSAFIQLRTTMIVDPLVMQRIASQRMPKMEVRDLTLGDVIQRFADHAGLRVTKEDGVLWLRSKR